MTYDCDQKNMIYKEDGREYLNISGGYKMIVKKSNGARNTNAVIKKKKAYNPEAMKNGWERFQTKFQTNSGVYEDRWGDKYYEN